MIIIIILILILILILAYAGNSCKKPEPFISDPLAHDSAKLDKEYKPTVSKKRQIWRPKELDAMKFETRHPGLLEQRYDYDDTEDKTCYPSLYNDFANLKELPLAHETPYHARVTKGLSLTSLEYNPSKNQDPNFVKEQSKRLGGDIEKVRNIPKSKVGSCCIPTEAMIPDRIIVTDSQGKTYPVPRDPLSALPANYADRSKTSTERLLGADLYKEYEDPIHEWMPWDNKK